MSMYEDKTLVCRDCNQEFVFSAGEQEFFAQKGFDKPPSRCPDCRKKRRSEKVTGNRVRTLYPITCAQCGKDGEVPFQPRTDNVLCADCFEKKRLGQATVGTPASTEAPAPAEEIGSDAAAA